MSLLLQYWLAYLFFFFFFFPVSRVSCLIVLLSALALVILVDGLQAPNISGKDDLHHEISHQSYESKNEFGIPLFDS